MHEAGRPGEVDRQLPAGNRRFDHHVIGLTSFLDAMNDTHHSKPIAVLWERVVAGDTSAAFLEAQGIEVRLGRPNLDPAYRTHRAQDFIEDLQGAHGVLISGGIRVSADVIRALPDLRVISKIGIGVDTVDIDAATAADIAVCNTPHGNDTVYVAEHAMTLLLALMKQLHVWTRPYMTGGGWRSPATFASSLDERTVGIVGFGRIGREFAQRLSGWNVRILVYDPYASDLPASVERVALEELLASSDVISLHCPPLPDGRPLLDSAALKRLRNGALLVNTARAALVDRQALLAALDAGQIAGAAIDVFDPEPPASNDPLLTHPKILTTPHVASWTHEAFFGRRRQAAENLAHVLLGRAGASVVNGDRLKMRGRKA